MLARRTNGRDRITNGRLLDGSVDLRSAAGRRFKHLVTSYTAECGRELTELELSQIRQAAAVQLRVEALQANIVRGDHVDSDEIIRLSSEHRRLISSLQDRAAQNKPARPVTLAQILADDDA
jgi:hypothetical protein